ncbi:MAG: DUF1801 domain-containing protein [Bacteroidetes bacterium]|nr:MAG: DUF1801 domain-containing protein [Bacteroidota bacterium]
MAELKTKLNDGSVEDFINSVENEQKREDSFKLLKMMEEITGEPGKMWGTAIVGFGSYHYVYASGREGDWMLTGFSPRKSSISLYLMAGFDELEDELSSLGKHKVGKGCLYINKLSDIDEKVLRGMIKKSNKIMRKRYS